jgi:hypothetical protein
MFNYYVVGDRIRCITSYDCNDSIVGSEGTVVSVANDDIGVEFDGIIDGGHNVDGYGRQGCCWWFYARDAGSSCLDLITPLPFCGPPLPPLYHVYKKCQTLWNKSNWVQAHPELAY